MYETLKTNNHTHQGVQFFSSLLRLRNFQRATSARGNIHRGYTRVNHQQKIYTMDAHK
jgi:hypothetical protein